MFRHLLPSTACLLTTMACSGPSAHPTAEPSPTPSPTAGPPPTVASLPPPPTVAPAPPTAAPAPPSPTESAIPSARAVETPPPYPSAWIEEAERENRKLSCAELVYKRGCAELRTGHVVVEVTLAADGTVASMNEVENDIARDPKVVSKCVRAKLPKWKFRAPAGVSPTFQVTLIFSDKC